MSKILESMTDQQLEILLNYRKLVQQSTAQLIEDLANTDHKNASLVALAETSAIVGDVIYITSLFGNNQLNLSLNNCSNIEEFREKLFVFVIHEMIAIVNQYLKINELRSENISEEDLKAAQSAIKH